MTAALLILPDRARLFPAWDRASIPEASCEGAAKKRQGRTKTPEQKKAEDKAYKDAVGRIPDQKFDPWGTVR